MPTKAGAIPKRPTLAWYKRELKAADKMANQDMAMAKSNALRYQEQIQLWTDRALAMETRLASLPTRAELEALANRYRLHSDLSRELHAAATHSESRKGNHVSLVTWERAADLLEMLLRSKVPPMAAQRCDMAAAGSPSPQYAQQQFKHPPAKAPAPAPAKKKPKKPKRRKK